MKYILILLLALSSFNSESSMAQEKGEGGGCGGHGGDGISQEFYQIGKLLYQQIQKLSSAELTKISSQFKINMFKQALEQTHITTTELPIIITFKGKDIEVDAKNSLNSNKPEITINRKRWNLFADFFGVQKKESLVLHEYLGVIKSLYPESGEWDEYSLSSDLLDLILKHSDLSSYFGEIWTKEVLAEFEKSSSNINANLERGTNYSCLEYSLLNTQLAPMIHLDLYNNSILGSNMIENIQTIEQTDTKIINEFRINTRGDLIIKNSQSITYCSKLGSKAVQMIKFLNESLTPILEVTKTSDFAIYQQKIKNLSKSQTYTNCTSLKSNRACRNLLQKLEKIKLAPEHNAVMNAKSNINQLNSWLDSLGEKKFLINQPILDLYSKYTNHQSYIQNLLDLGDSMLSTPHGKKANDIGLKNFVDSLTNRLPLAYENAKNEFEIETQEAEEALVKSFSILF